MDKYKYSDDTKAVLFDLDGVLVDAANWHRDAFNQSLINHGYEPLTQEDHMETFNGLSTKKKLSILIERGTVQDLMVDDKIMSESIHHWKQRYTIDLIRKHCKPIQRVINTVNYVRCLGISAACVTNCSRETATLMLSLSDLAGKFQTIVTNGDVDGKIKPHPFPYLLAQSNLGIKNQRKSCIAVDDTEKGIMSAVEAGCNIWHLHKYEDLSVDNMAAYFASLRIGI